MTDIGPIKFEVLKRSLIVQQQMAMNESTFNTLISMINHGLPVMVLSERPYFEIVLPLIGMTLRNEILQAVKDAGWECELSNKYLRIHNVKEIELPDTMPESVSNVDLQELLTRKLQGGR